MIRRGFTIVELLIVITIMGILLVLAVVNLRGTQAQSRDDQRTGDMQTLASNLEDFYSNGSGLTTNLGRYPSTALVANLITTIDGPQTTPATVKTLANIDSKAIIAPNKTTVAASFVAATNATQTAAGVTPQPDNSTVSYVYQPMYYNQSTGAWALCTNDTTQECRKFNLYYKTEVDGVVQMIQSRNQ